MASAKNVNLVPGSAINGIGSVMVVTKEDVVDALEIEISFKRSFVFL
jgi:hypothetical protein